ncbi:MAG TPA: hypothetical protein VMW80_02090 [Candidatus Dormibacteraeota bacterium]|nr:hypothetical protein [Candidatus Dormibacteraeota bacterium]
MSVSLEQLQELGEALPVSSQPTASTSSSILAGLVYYLDTGSLTAPVVAAPDPVAVAAASAEQTELARAQSELNKLKRQLAAAQAPASPVSLVPTAPTSPVPVEPVVPAVPVSTEPAPPAAPLVADPAPTLGS